MLVDVKFNTMEPGEQFVVMEMAGTSVPGWLLVGSLDSVRLSGQCCFFFIILFYFIF